MFPKPIALPETVEQSRQERRQRMLRTSKAGVGLRSVIILAEIAGFVYFNSSALLLDALSSLMDVASSLFLILCIRWADKPPDKEHPFGHGRFEPIAGLQLGLLLIVLGSGMLVQQVAALTHERASQAIDARTWVIPLCAVVLLEISYQLVRRTAKRQQSPALLADAVHYRIDALNSLFATAALGCGALFPQYSADLDHVGAVLIAVLMVIVGALASRNNVRQLLDRTPDEQYFRRVRSAAKRVPGVLETEKVRIQLYGPDAHVNIDVEVDPALSVEVAHALTQQVRAEIQREWPAVRDATVHVEPYYADDHKEQ
jgi:cation diffusion facilitator family transporter